MLEALPQAVAIAIASFKDSTAFPPWCPWSIRPPEMKQEQETEKNEVRRKID